MTSPTRRKTLISLGTSPVWITPVVKAVVLPAHAQTSLAGVNYFRADIPADFALIHVLLTVNGNNYTARVSDRDGGGNGFEFVGNGVVGGGEIALTNVSSGVLDCVDLDAFINVLSVSATQAIANYRNTFGPSFNGEAIPVGNGAVVPSTCAGPATLTAPGQGPSYARPR